MTPPLGHQRLVCVGNGLLALGLSAWGVEQRPDCQCEYEFSRNIWRTRGGLPGQDLVHNLGPGSAAYPRRQAPGVYVVGLCFQSSKPRGPEFKHRLWDGCVASTATLRKGYPRWLPSVTEAQVKLLESDLQSNGHIPHIYYPEVMLCGQPGWTCLEQGAGQQGVIKKGRCFYRVARKTCPSQKMFVLSKQLKVGI